jgi:hypothetical protein
VKAPKKHPARKLSTVHRQHVLLGDEQQGLAVYFEFRARMLRMYDPITVLQRALASVNDVPLISVIMPYRLGQYDSTGGNLITRPWANEDSVIKLSRVARSSSEGWRVARRS